MIRPVCKSAGTTQQFWIYEIFSSHKYPKTGSRKAADEKTGEKTEEKWISELRTGWFYPNCNAERNFFRFVPRSLGYSSSVSAFHIQNPVSKPDK